MENHHMANSAEEQMLKLSFVAIYLNVALMTSCDCDHCVGWSAPAGRSPHQPHRMLGGRQQQPLLWGNWLLSPVPGAVCLGAV